MRTKLKLFIPVVIILGVFIFINTSLASTTCVQKYSGYGTCQATACSANFQTDSTSGLCSAGEFCCYKTAGGGSTSPSLLESLSLQVPIFDKANISNLPEYIVTIYQYLIIILIPIAVIMIMIGGIIWLTAGGDQNKVTNAKNYITSAFSGLIIALFSYVLLSLVGITSIKEPYVENIPEVFIDNETTGADLCDSSKPYCGSSSTRLNPFRFNDFFIKSAEAAYTKPPLIKQHDSKWANHKYGVCGTIRTSGCGVTSLTMAISYLTGQLVSVTDVADLAAASGYRKCTGDGRWDEAKQDCIDCHGTDYPAFRTGSAILNKYGLKGKNLMGQGAVTNIVNAVKANGVVIISVSGVNIGDSKHPVTKANNRFTASGHFILLFGCKDCDNKDPSKVIMGVFDPNLNNSYITQKELLTPKFLNSAHLIYK